MLNISYRRCVLVLLASLYMLDYSRHAAADDLTSFMTSGYSAGLRTKEMMNIMDTDGDGSVSRAEWTAFHEKVFNSLDTHKRGKLNVAIFASRTEIRLGDSVATGGYARGLNSEELAHKIDTNADGWISRDEWMTYQNTVFDMMKTNTSRDTLGPDEMFATGARSNR